MAINTVQFERLKTLLKNSNETVTKASKLFAEMESLKKSYDSITPQEIDKIVIVEKDKDTFDLSTDNFNLTVIANRIKADVEAKYNVIFKSVSDLLIKKVTTTTTTPPVSVK